jgi:hypothetical protein
MTSSTSNTADILKDSLIQLKKLRHLSDKPIQFWSAYLDIIKFISSADAGIIALNTDQNNSTWQPVSFFPQEQTTNQKLSVLIGQLSAAAACCENDSTAFMENSDFCLLAASINTGIKTQRCVALLHIAKTNRHLIKNSIDYIKLINDIPAFSLKLDIPNETTIQKVQLAEILDLMILINVQESFLSAAMTFCNEIASRYKCDRASLGWIHKNDVRLQIMSNVDSFDKKMDAVRKLEQAMEETVDQETCIILPASEENNVISRDHEQYCRNQDIKYICSIPILVNEVIVAVCTFERNTSPFTSQELQLLQITSTQAARRLHDLKKNDRWIGALVADRLRKRLSRLLGFQHTWEKLLAIIISVLLILISFVPVTYRLESPVILRTENVANLTSPFDGHIERVYVRVGDNVKKNDTLMTLDQNDLILDVANLTAEKNRYMREADKARAANELADMRIAEAIYDQTVARLAAINHRLDHVIIKAPFDGIIVDGDQKERIGSPIKQGEMLFKIARIDNIFAELEVKESEITHVFEGLSGDIVLAGKPHQKFNISVSTLESSTTAKSSGNVFIVNCTTPKDSPDWWRPGMTGIGKLNAGKRTILWILTHRSIDFLKLHFWW